MSSKRILVIDPFPPAPDTNSGGRRLFEILRLMKAEGHQVTFMPQNAYFNDPRYLIALEQLGITTASAPPGQLVNEREFREFFKGKAFDVVVISFYHVAKLFLPLCREMFPQAKIIIDTVDLHFVREERQAQLHQDPNLARKALQTRREELAIYSKADALWAVTPNEKETLHTEVAVRDVAVVPNIHEVRPILTPFSQRDGLLFVGNFAHPPNAEGLAWYATEVLPIVRQRFPDLKTTVVGNNPPAFLNDFKHLGVELAGWVPDLEQLLGKARLSIAPLLHGAGMKGKVGEALAAGLPVVTTPIGSEGMGLSHGENVLVAGNPAAFASAIVMAYSTEELWRMLAVNGAAFMEAHYTPRTIQVAIHDALTPETHNYLAVPDWQDETDVKHVVDGYVQRYAGDNTANLCLAVVSADINLAADNLVRWIAELGHDVEEIPNIDLTPMSPADLANVDATTVWVPTTRNMKKPSQLTEIASFETANA